MTDYLPPNYVRELGPDDTWMVWSTPPGYRRVVVDATSPLSRDLGWVVNTDPARRCRYNVPHPERRSNRGGCGRPAVVALHRGASGRLWGYCDNDEHLFGRHWDAEHQRLLGTVLVEDGDG